MTFEAYEDTVQGSRPVELYDFTYQGIHLRYTSADRDITIAGITYTAAPISRSAITDTTDIAKATLTLSCAPHFDVSELFSVAPPDDVVGLVVTRFQKDDPDVEMHPFWLGRVVNCAWPTGQSTLRCESVYTALKQPGLRRPYSKNCPYVVYGADCQANILTFQQSIVITNQVGNVINAATLGSHPDGWWAGGRAYWESSPGFFVKRGVKNHVGTQVELTHPMAGIPGGATVVFAPGCDHSFFTCGGKFSNAINYGGAPNMQQKNPFGQSNVF